MLFGANAKTFAPGQRVELLTGILAEDISEHLHMGVCIPDCEYGVYQSTLAMQFRVMDCVALLGEVYLA